MKIFAPALALALAAVASYSDVHVDASVAAATCDVPANTLVFDKCSKSCAKWAPCMSNAACKVECFNAYYDSKDDPKKKQNQFFFSVLFGKWKSEQEKASKVKLPEPKPYTGKGEGVKSNDELTKIAKLTLPNTVDTVLIRGGLTEFEVDKSRVANVEFDPSFLTDSALVANVGLENLNLAKVADKLLASFPPKIKSVSFSNGLLTEVPPSISKFATLRELDLSHNYIASIASSTKAANLTVLNLKNNAFTEVPTALPTLTELNLNNNSIAAVSSSSSRTGLTKLELQGNKINKFEATYKDLTYLDLSYNNLTEVPAAIKQLAKLKELEISNNKLTKFDGSFANVESLSLDGNKLTEIPSAIFTLKNLKHLFLHNNPMKDVVLTKEQAAVLQKLETFTIDYEAPKKDCRESLQVKVDLTTFCTTRSVHHHHRHHHRGRQNDNDDEVTVGDETATEVAAEEKPTEAPVTVTEVSTALSATDATAKDVTSGDSSNRAADNELVVALSSGAGGFMAVVVAILAVAINKKHRVAETTADADASEIDLADEEQKEEEEENSSGVVGASL